MEMEIDADVGTCKSAIGQRKERERGVADFVTNILQKSFTFISGSKNLLTKLATCYI